MKIFLLLFLNFSLCCAVAEQTVIGGSKILGMAVTEAVFKLRNEMGLDLMVTEDVPSSEGTSTGGIALLGTGKVQIAMSSRALTVQDRSKYPDITFTSIYLGEQTVAVAVSRDVWESGVRSVSREQLQGIYEGKITNWKQLGGEDQKILFFNRQIGKGAWEVYAEWLYHDNRKAPLGRFQAIAEDIDVRDAVELSTGAIAPLSPVWIDGKNLFALALIEEQGGDPVPPTAQNIIEGKYKMSRPLYFFIDDKPAKQVKAMVDFMTGDGGQEILKKHGFLGRKAIETGLGKALPLAGPSN